jgi:hypothetical protein
VPGLVGRGGPGGALLTKRVAGRSDAPSGDDLEPVLSDLMRHLAELHRLTPETFALPELTTPSSAAGLALDQLSPIETRYRETPSAQHPLVDFGLGWLRRAAPQDIAKVSLVHGDAGPGNLIYGEKRVQAIVDWEIAHWGDAMEDLAGLATRDMATPIGDLGQRLSEYQSAGGARIDRERLLYYRVLVLIRNSALICLTLANAAESPALVALRPFALLLRRAATQALCEAVGLAFPIDASSEPSLPNAPLEDDEHWIPILALRAQFECAAQRDVMGRLADRFLQPVPA